jgi:hypothetical protein
MVSNKMPANPLQVKLRLTRAGFQIGKPMLERGEPQVFGSVAIARARVHHVWLPATIGEVIAVIVARLKDRN